MSGPMEVLPKSTGPREVGRQNENRRTLLTGIGQLVRSLSGSTPRVNTRCSPMCPPDLRNGP